MDINNELELVEVLKNADAKEGLELIEKYKDIVVKKYYEVTKFEITFLIESKKYIDAKLLIKNELSVPYIPKEFELFLNEKNRFLEGIMNISDKHSSIMESLDKLESLDEDELMNVIPYLKDYNLNNYIDKFQIILLNQSIRSSYKTIIIALLADNKINYNFKVFKNGMLYEINPIESEDVRESNCYKHIEEELSKVHDIEINYIENIKELVSILLLDIYPESLDDNNADILLAACIKEVASIVNNQIIIPKYEKIMIKDNKLVEYYQNKLENIIKAFNFN